MTNYRCYMRAILLSIIAAIVIDAVINFDQYRTQWVASFGEGKFKENQRKAMFLPVERKTASEPFRSS